nr:hypothetical protein CFP56_54435 [Quercus suber]
MLRPTCCDSVESVVLSSRACSLPEGPRRREPRWVSVAQKQLLIAVPSFGPQEVEDFTVALSTIMSRRRTVRISLKGMSNGTGNRPRWVLHKRMNYRKHCNCSFSGIQYRHLRPPPPPDDHTSSKPVGRLSTLLFHQKTKLTEVAVTAHNVRTANQRQSVSMTHSREAKERAVPAQNRRCTAR